LSLLYNAFLMLLPSYPFLSSFRFCLCFLLPSFLLYLPSFVSSL
jgi:hypothetical protein